VSYISQAASLPDYQDIDASASGPNAVYAIIKLNDSQSVLSYNGITWKGLGSLSSRRDHNPCVFLLGNKLYVAGGKHESGVVLSSMESLDLGDNQATWKLSVNLPFAVFKTECATVGDTVYLAGGESDVIKNSTISWKVGQSSWTPLPSLKYARKYHCTVAVGIYLFVIGGEYNWRLSSVERYNTYNNTSWEKMAQVPVKIKKHRCVCISDTIIVTGGTTSHGVVDSIYLYFVSNNTWTLSPTRLQHPTKAHTMGVLP